MAGNADVAENITVLRSRMATAAAAARRAPDAARLLAVSKLQPEERVDAALAAGQRLFGENRVQEAQARWRTRRGAYSDLELHLIGPLQTNKVRDAVALFDVIQTVDRAGLAEKLAAEMRRQGRHLPCLIQVNTGNEPQKAGVAPAGLPALHDLCRGLGLAVRGLMCIPPADADPAPHFDMLARLAAERGLPELSMGMSADYEAAIARGATYVRVGTALFGGR